MRWTLALSSLSLLAFACTDAPRSLLTDLPPAPIPDMAMEIPPDLTPPDISITSVTPNTVSTVGRDQITITGVGFDTRTTFRVGGTVAEAVSITSTQAVVLAPANPGTFGVPVSIQALRTDGARANNNNGMTSMSRFSYYASTLNFQQIARFNYNNSTPRVPLVGDFNGDGRQDIALGYTAAQHQVMLNTGGGGFVLVENNNNPPSNLGFSKGAVVDLNNDTFLDWIVSDGGAGGSTWAYFLGNGQGLFTNAPTPFQNSYAPGGCGNAESPVPIKLSSATSFDVAVACQANSVVRIWSASAGSGNGALYGGTNTTNQHTNISVNSPSHLQVVDVNNDKYNDLVVLTINANQPTLSWFNSPAAAPPQTLPTTATGNTGTTGLGANNLNQVPYWMKCVDLNNDQYPDCVVADNNTSTVRVFMNNAGTYVAPAANGVFTVGPTAGDLREINLADMNGDGKLDVLVTSRTFNNFEVIPGRGDGTFGTISSMDGRTLVGRVTTTLADCLRPWSILVADFDGDGIRDIVTTCEANAGNNTSLGGFLVLKNVSR